MEGPTNAELDRARVVRDRLFARMTFWERWRSLLVGPVMILGALLGLLVGLGLEELFHLPDRTKFFGAAIGILLLGRGVGAFFDVRKLEVARRRAESLERMRTRRG